jgi:hypothetical protein
MKNIVEQQLYANIEVGTPKKTIQLPLLFGSNDFYIMEQPLKDMPENRFSDIKVYDTNSSTLEEVDEDREDYYSYNGDMFDFGIYHTDNFYFNNQTYKLEFYLAEKHRVIESGGIGLQLYPSSDTYDSAPNIKFTFLDKLKKQKIIKKYFWTIFYNSKKAKKEEEGTILLGCRPHEFEGDLGFYKKGCFNDSNRKIVNLAVVSPYRKNIIEMDGIYAYEGSNNEKLIEDFPNDNNNFRIELDYHSGGVKAPNRLKIFYHRIFEEHILSGNCFNNTFQKNDKHFYYCKKNDKVLSKIKNVFPKLIFMSRDLTYNFTLDYNDLFVEENDYVFCLLYFASSTETSWIMGKPFLRKYVFVFNYDEQYVDFYLNTCETGETGTKEEQPKNNGVSTTVLVISIIGTIIIVIIICILVFKFYLYDKMFRKKRANELDDADFEYVSKGDENKLGF